LSSKCVSAIWCGSSSPQDFAGLFASLKLLRESVRAGGMRKKDLEIPQRRQSTNGTGIGRVGHGIDFFGNVCKYLRFCNLQ
jgi:hypothetical protein